MPRKRKPTTDAVGRIAAALDPRVEIRFVPAKKVAQA